MEEICGKFNALNWHDSKLIGICLVRDESGTADTVRLDLRMIDYTEPFRSRWKQATLLLKECTLLRLDIDLDGKRVCSDSIWSATCARDSSLKEEIERVQLRNEVKPLANYLHFEIRLIEPGGRVDAFAKSFELEIRHEEGA